MLNWHRKSPIHSISHKKSIQAYALIGLALLPSLSAADADDDPAPPAASEQLDLPAARQQLAGIQTQRLQAAQQQTEFSSYGTVVNPEPLLSIRQQYLAASSQQAAAQARYSEAEHNMTRSRQLHQQDIVSTRRLQEQQALWQADKANLAANSYQQQTIVASSRLLWGETLTSWFTQPQSQAAEQILNHQTQLLLINLPVNKNLHPSVTTIYIDARGQRQTAVRATLIAASPQIDPVSQGSRYFFSCQGCNLAYGAHVSAWIPDQQQSTHGVNIPSSALVWHLGQAFVFVKTATDSFSRRHLNDYTPNAHGYFVPSALQAGEEIAITGAQTLLSQQLKGSIPSEDKD